MFEPMESSSVQFGSVFTIFKKRNQTKLVGLVWFGSIWLIYLFENTIKKIHIFTNLYFMHTTYSNIS